jgi:hypothetical protein
MRQLWKLIVRRASQWFSWHFRRYTLKSAVKMPEEKAIRERVAYWVGEEGHKWCLVFRCPCGCHEIIYLNLLPNTRPAWRLVKYGKKSFSISPSVNRVRGCRAHFFLRKGRVVWV